jgi:RimJ/RimL family protein N-acetyltransferase
MANPYQSKRLIYRAVDPDDDVDFFRSVDADPIAQQNSDARILKPKTKADAKDMVTYFTEKCLLGVIICLPPTTPDAKPAPIGYISLQNPPPHMLFHRHTTLGINILAQYQGQGYGSEAILWATEWAFINAGMNRVAIRAFEFNEGARRLYEKLGFKPEGVQRELLWAKGRFWDDYGFAMLAREWHEMYGSKK